MARRNRFHLNLSPHSPPRNPLIGQRLYFVASPLALSTHRDSFLQEDTRRSLRFPFERPTNSDRLPRFFLASFFPIRHAWRGLSYATSPIRTSTPSYECFIQISPHGLLAAPTSGSLPILAATLPTPPTLSFHSYPLPPPPPPAPSSLHLHPFTFTTLPFPPPSNHPEPYFL